MNDRQKLVQTLVGVHGFYDRELTEFAIRVWEEAVRDIPIADIELAFRRHLSDPQRGQFMPKPADIIRQLRGDETDRALMAWGVVIARAKSGGGFIASDCEATRQAIQAMGGWSALCRADESQNGFLQRRFTDLFATYARRAEAPLLTGDAHLKLAR